MKTHGLFDAVPGAGLRSRRVDVRLNGASLFSVQLCDPSMSQNHIGVALQGVEIMFGEALTGFVGCEQRTSCFYKFMEVLARNRLFSLEALVQ